MRDKISGSSLTFFMPWPSPSSVKLTSRDRGSHNAVVVILAFALENVIDFGIALVDVIAYFTVFLKTAETEQAPLVSHELGGKNGLIESIALAALYVLVSYKFAIFIEK